MRFRFQSGKYSRAFIEGAIMGPMGIAAFCVLVDNEIHRGIGQAAQRMEEKKGWSRKTLMYNALALSAASITVGQMMETGSSTETVKAAVINGALAMLTGWLGGISIEREQERTRSRAIDVRDITRAIFKTFRFPLAVKTFVTVAAALYFFSPDTLTSSIHFATETIAFYLASSTNGFVDWAREFFGMPKPIHAEASRGA